MDDTTTLAVVGAVVVLVCAGRLLAAMLGGGRGAAGTRASFPRVRHVGRRAGASAVGGPARRDTLPGIGRVGRLADDEVRRALDALKAKTPPRRR